MPNPINSDGNVQTLADGGYFVTATDTDIKRLAVSEVATGLAPAITAIQQSDATPIVAEDPEAYVRVAAYDADIASLEATIAAMQAQIAALMEQ